jgi:hypothetical protein
VDGCGCAYFDEMVYVNRFHGGYCSWDEEREDGITSQCTKRRCATVVQDAV